MVLLICCGAVICAAVAVEKLCKTVLPLVDCAGVHGC